MMREIQVKELEAGQRLDKYLRKYFPGAPDSFLYKMLRKKNIILNGQKAEGKERLRDGDVIRFYLSEDTIEKFREKPETAGSAKDLYDFQDPAIPDISGLIVYEDEHVLVLNKPAGLLSQKASPEDISAVEAVTKYMLDRGEITVQELRTFHPAVCNRLDRNTSGLLIAGKSLKGLQIIDRLLKRRSLEKYYLCLVRGRLTRPLHIKGYLRKDPETNCVTISDDEADGAAIETAYEPLAWNDELTLLFVHLLTGRPHQIRAHLASEGHPLLGDYKYGIRSFNDKYREQFGIESQMLHAYELRFPQMPEPLTDLSGKVLRAAVPENFYNVIKETLWEHGTQEALEVLH